MDSYIFQLPWELTFNVFHLLDLEDAFHLGLVCKYFYSAICDDNLCRKLLQLNAPYSPECLAAEKTAKWHRAFCTLVKRKQAIRNADPFAVGIVAVADRYLYVNGTLVYRNGGSLRVLSLRGRAATESVIDIRCLLNEYVPESKGVSNYLLIPLHYADGIVACRYTHMRQGVKENWLLLVDVHRHKASAHRISTAYRIFVRHNGRHLVYGTYTVQAEDGYRRWVLRQYSFATDCWAEQMIYLDDVVGSAMGSNIFIDIIDDYLYVLANQTSFEPRSTARSSYYYCCRFRLGWRDKSDSSADADCYEQEMATMASRWRRQNIEGPIDDRWTFLRLEKDERTGDIMVVELRNEYRAGRNAAQRTYYKQVLDFEPKRGQTGGTVWPKGDNAPSPSWHHNGDRPPISAQDCRHPGYSTSSDSGEVYAVHPYRQPANVHPYLASKEAGTRLLTLNNCLFFNYFSTSAAPVDILNTPSPVEPNVHKISISISTRFLRPEARKYEIEPQLGHSSAYCTLPSPVLSSPSSSLGSEQEDALYPIKRIEEQYISCPPKVWPPERLDDSRKQELQAILNPPGHRGQIEATSDEHLLLYQTGGVDGAVKALVAVVFDPTICLVGLQRWGGGGVSAGKAEAMGNDRGREEGGKEEKEKEKEKEKEREKEKEEEKEEEKEKGKEKKKKAKDATMVQAAMEDAEAKKIAEDRPLCDEKRDGCEALEENSPESGLLFDSVSAQGAANATNTASRRMGMDTVPVSGRWLKQAKPMFQEINRGFHFSL